MVEALGRFMDVFAKGNEPLGMCNMAEHEIPLVTQRETSIPVTGFGGIQGTTNSPGADVEDEGRRGH
jgi:hypothetical protein